MTITNEKKLKKLLDQHKLGTVCVTGWLESIGISYQLLQYYKDSDWLQAVGTGAFKRPNEHISWEGGLYAIQYQESSPIHAGGLTALSKQGLAHYIRAGSTEQVYLFSPVKTTLPAWFKNYDWLKPIRHIKTFFLPVDKEIIEFEEKNFNIMISTPERAILECLYLTPDKMDLIECYQILEGMLTLRPNVLQELLENCKSIKVKRLFLYMAEKINHSWYNFINQDKINIGQGDRSIVKGGVYIPKYKLVIPRELAEL